MYIFKISDILFLIKNLKVETYHCHKSLFLMILYRYYKLKLYYSKAKSKWAELFLMANKCNVQKLLAI